MTPITVATNTPGTPIPVGTTPLGIAITPDGTTVYVANNSDNSVTPITVATNTALSSCWLMRVSGAVLDQDGVAVALWSGGCGGQSGDLVPGGESGGHLMAILGRCESVASRSEMR